MKWLGTKRVALKSIILPGNFSATRAAPRITELATSIREHGVIHLPVVQAGTLRLIVGHDRIAALMALKEKHVEVRVWEGSEDEFHATQLSENLHRRHGDDRTAMIAEYARITERDLTRGGVSQPSETVDITRSAVPAASGPASQTIAKKTNAVTAAAAGIKPASVSQAKRRAKKKAPEPAPEPEAPTEVPLPEGFAAYGIDIPAADREVIAETLGWLKDLEAEARRTVAAMTDAEKHRQFSIAPSHIQGIRERAAALGHALREAMPAGLCPYCKFRPALVSNCAGCGGVGVVGRHAGDHVPRELLGSEVVMVAVDGQVVPLAAAKPAKKNGEPIHVEVIDEVGAAPRELTLDRTAAEESEELF